MSIGGLKYMQDKQIDIHRLPVRLPNYSHKKLLSYIEKYGGSMNAAIIALIDKGWELENKESENQSLALFCGHYNGKNYEESAKFINSYFKDHPKYKLINLQVMPDNCGIYYFYQIPVDEDKRVT